MALLPKLRELLQAIGAATAGKRIRWQETADEDSFRAILASGMVRIGHEIDPDTATAFFLITILNEKGRVVEEWRVDGYLDTPDHASNSHQDPDYLQVDEIYRRARAQAMNSEGVVDRIIAEVQAVGR